MGRFKDNILNKWNDTHESQIVVGTPNIYFDHLGGFSYEFSILTGANNTVVKFSLKGDFFEALMGLFCTKKTYIDALGVTSFTMKEWNEEIGINIKNAIEVLRKEVLQVKDFYPFISKWVYYHDPDAPTQLANGDFVEFDMKPFENYLDGVGDSNDNQVADFQSKQIYQLKKYFTYQEVEFWQSPTYVLIYKEEIYQFLKVLYRLIDDGMNDGNDNVLVIYGL